MQSTRIAWRGWALGSRRGFGRCLLAADTLLHEGRGQHDGQPQDHDHHGEARHPGRQAQPGDEGLDALEGDPGSDEVDPQHLPERAPVDLLDEALQA